jgi:hypothetical protein
MAGEREHLAAQPHKLDAVLVIPSDHLRDITSIRKPKVLNPSLSKRDVRGLFPVRPVLGRMFRLAWIFEGMPVFEYGRNATCSRTKDRRIRIAEVRVQAGLDIVSSLLEEEVFEEHT